MTDVNHIWAAMLDDTEPPLPTAQETLTTARRSVRRRRALTTALLTGGAGVTCAVVAVAAAAAGGSLSGAAPVMPAAPVTAPATTEAPPPVPRPVAPGWQAVHAHGPQAGAVLVAAAPPGYTSLLQQLSTNGPASTWQVQGGTEYVSTVDVILTTGQADGMLTVFVHGGMTGLGDDLCAAPVSTAITFTGCDLVTVNGVQLRVHSGHDPEYGDVSVAVRLLDGGLLVVQAQQGIPAHSAGDLPPDADVHTPKAGEHSILGGWPALPAVPLTPAQVAGIAANPALLP